MPIHFTLLRPGENLLYPPHYIIFEFAPVLTDSRCDSLEKDRQYWGEAGESPDIVVAHEVLDFPEEIENYIDALREREGPDRLEYLLTMVFNLGRTYPKK
ncbi:MAG: hypothetical protein A3E38_02760 [Candidatus Moranbacteria bacterium RIFCSPHIGHO2_12_FULL_54_9]|nr:MAG: hypothetical protein A2878_00400 [Candidatus Moranbacteria bacterium RIFCSPHIGHO2_01_FULL_54_31]OGI25757.1 MAG: hypothetical protein A3E38_02760 [Candidatus Moranbacteria bacterium RIFCSPHIGHO2_12_FULL_54_9]